MNLRPLAILLALATSGFACGGKGGAPSLDNRAGAASADDPVGALEALVRAIDTDDGAALAALVDPTDGLTLWNAPGAGYAVFDTVKPGDAAPPSRHVGSGDPEEGGGDWAEHYWPSVVRSIRDGLTRLDRDPANPGDEIYGTCADEEREFRAYLTRGNDDASLRSMDLGGDGEVPPDQIRRELVLFHTWGFSAYLARHDGRWHLVHLLVTEPCSA